MIEIKKNYISVLLTSLKFLQNYHTKLISIMKNANIPDHETILIINRYWNQEAVVRTINGDKEKIKIKKRCSTKLYTFTNTFNLYSEYLIQEAFEAAKGVKIK